MKLSNKLFFSVILSTFLTQSCSDTEFSQDNPKKKQTTPSSGADAASDGGDNTGSQGNKIDPNEVSGQSNILPESERQLITLSCDQLKQGLLTKTETGNLSKQFKIKGEICLDEPKVEQQVLNIAFVVDLSGSMEENDPLINGSCGRYQSIVSLADKVRSQVNENVKVNIGIVGFSSTSYTLMVMQPLKAGLTFPVNSICQMNGNTNYKAALDSAYDMLKPYNGKGKQMVYFISDGLPYLYGYSAQQMEASGLESANYLRQNITDLSFYTVYLKGKIAVGNPLEYLTKVTGKAENVRLVANAGDLAPEIEKFELPVLEDIKAPVIKLSSGSYGDKPLQVVNMKKIDDKHWSFETDYFTAYGENGSTVENEISIISEEEGLDVNFKLKLEFAGQAK